MILYNHAQSHDHAINAFNHEVTRSITNIFLKIISEVQCPSVAKLKTL